MNLPWYVIAISGVGVILGSMVQGSTGFGVSLLGVPVMLLVDPTLLPGSMLVVGCVLPFLTLTREGRHVQWPIATMTIVGRAVGTFAGVWVVSTLSNRAFAVGLGLFLLLGVGLSLLNVVVPVTRGTLFGAGALTGITGTASSISGPVVGLVLQRMPGASMRATMAAFFGFGTMVSLAGLAIGHELTVRQIVMGLAMVPFLTAGYALSGPVRRYLDRGWTRPAVLGVSGASALVVLIRALFFG